MAEVPANFNLIWRQRENKMFGLFMDFFGKMLWFNKALFWRISQCKIFYHFVKC